MHATPSSFSFRYGALAVLMTALGLGPRHSSIDVSAQSIDVHMGWGFRAAVPRANIRSVERASRVVGGIGVHGWRGRWLVNGSTLGIVTLTVEPPARAHVMGFPVVLRQLSLSLDQPDEFITTIEDKNADEEV